MAAGGTELATAYVSLAIESSKVADGAAKGLGVVEQKADQTGRSAGAKMGGGLGSGILGAAKSFMGPIAAAFSVAAVTDFLKDSVAEAQEARKIGALTVSTIKATGGAAKISAEQVGDLANAISRKTGIDDEAIQSGSNLLLTFKNVRNEVGAGNDIFNQATQAAVDLSAAGFGSVESSSKMLGKALNDPIQGISALSRAGVQFTDQQKDQIKTMVESGDVLGAQKLIMAELTSQVGGAAEAQATASDKLAVAWGNIKESLGEKLLPVLDRVANWFLNVGLPAIESFGGWLTNNRWPALKQGYEAILPGIQTALKILGDGLGENGIKWSEVGDFITNKAIPAMSFVMNAVLPVLAANLRTLWEALKLVWTGFQFWVGVVTSAASVILGAFISIIEGFASVLRALSNVPGFGWAKDAADKMQNTADKARGIQAAIDSINPWKSITVQINAIAGRIDDGSGQMVNRGLRAAGGPVTAGRPYIVGELRRELFVPNQSGQVLPYVPEGAGVDPRALASAVSAALDGSRLELTGVDRITGHMSARLVGAIGRV